MLERYGDQLRAAGVESVAIPEPPSTTRGITKTKYVSRANTSLAECGAVCVQREYCVLIFLSFCTIFPTISYLSRVRWKICCEHYAWILRLTLNAWKDALGVEHEVDLTQGATKPLEKKDTETEQAAEVRVLMRLPCMFLTF